MREFNLQRALARARTPSEDFEDQACSVDDLCVPRLLQITLLNRRYRAVHNYNGCRQAFHQAGDLIDFALADIGRGPNIVERHESSLDHGQVDSAGKANGLFKARFGRTHICRRARTALMRVNFLATAQ